MKTAQFTGTVLAICFLGIVCAKAETTNLTQHILQMQTFREGLVWTGSEEPTENENKALLEVLDHLQEPEWTADLDEFLREYPDSAWATSLHYDYASFCRRTGRTTKALEQYEAGWESTKNATDLQGKRLSGTVLANWTDLLSSLGRLEQLKKLVTIGDHWYFVDPRDREKFEGAKHSYLLMQAHPEIAYRCGTFALKAIGEQLQPGNQALKDLVEQPSPTNGFDMAGLVDLAKKRGLNLTAVRRTAGQDLIVPSVVHWRQNHYAAILKQQDGFYLVNDPTFGREKWLSAEVINEEASGEFLVPTLSLNGKAQASAWHPLARKDAQTIHGMGLPNNINDGHDKCCSLDFFGNVVCVHCPGMPVWWVSEPYINLWIADQPLSYKTSRGDPFTFQITYKQRDTRPFVTQYHVSTTGWNNSWVSFIDCESESACVIDPHNQGCLTGPGDADTTVFLANGGEMDFSPFQSYDAETRTEMTFGTYTEDGGNYANVGVRLIHADGSQDIYGFNLVIPVPAGDYAQTEYLRTRHMDAHGDTTWFYYGGNLLTDLYLSAVVDPDGRTNTLTYTGSLLSAVTNVYGQSAHFKYDSKNNLTNIVDAAGLSSSIKYDTNGYPTALMTPYGTNTFSIYVNANTDNTNGEGGNFGEDGSPYIDRAVQVTDPTGAEYLYLYQFDCAPFMSATCPAGTVPTNTPLGTLDDGSVATNSMSGVNFRNSFYWGPRQYPNLSTTNMFAFTASDYLRGRMQHWLEDSNELYLTGYLSAEQDPSPDGSTPGLFTFYDYQGKQPGFNFCEGTNARPSVKAWRLPGGETHYEYLLLDYFGNVTNDITTYTMPNGDFGTRTNQFVYADNTYTYFIAGLMNSVLTTNFAAAFTVPNLLTQVIGADGHPSWSYAGFDRVTTTNYFCSLDNYTTNVEAFIWSRVLPDYATNGVGQTATFTYTPATIPIFLYDTTSGDTSYVASVSGLDKIASATSVGGLTTTNLYYANGFLAQTIDWQTGRTNSFGYTTDGLPGSLTNELRLKLTATWDNLLRLTNLAYPDGTSVAIIYSKLDPYMVYDRLGNDTTYGYDGDRRLTSITRPNSTVLGFDWCGCGALTASIDPLGNLTEFNYDNAGNLTNIIYPDASAISYQYDLADRVTNMLDGAGRPLQVAYNNQGLVTSVSNAYGKVKGVVYDIRDRPVKITDANGITVTNTYDLLDRIVTRTWPDGISEGYGYSAQGLAFYTNRDHQVTCYGRDVAGRLTAITNANNEVVQIAYNPANEITNLVDGLHHTTSWQYDVNGWMTNKVDGLGHNILRLAYDANGWLTNRWTPEKGNTGYIYDSLGNLLTVNYPSSTIAYAYDADDRLTNMMDLSGTNTFSYTPLGQLAAETGPWGNNTVTNGYSQQLCTALNLTQASGSWSQTYGYDAAWRLASVVSPAGTFGYSYGFQPASPLVTGISLPNGANIANGYDSLARLTQTTLNNHWGHALDGYTYQTDPLGLRTNLLRDLGLTASSVSVGYDAIGQLTGWLAKETNGAPRLNEQLGFGYDAADNLNLRTNNALIQTFTVDAANELTNVSRSGTFTLSGATPVPATNITVNGQAAQAYGDFTFAAANDTLVNGNNTFTVVAQNIYGVSATNSANYQLPAVNILLYDANGNLTNDGTRTFAYDAENQLTNIAVAGQWRSDFVYDGLNRRRIVRDYGWNGSSWTKTNEVRYLYDGELILQERDTNNNVLVTYTRGQDWGGDIQTAGGIGGLLARTDGNGSTFYHADGSGNITALMDGNENIVARYLYNPFGKLLGQWGPLANANEMQFSSMPMRHGVSLYSFRGYEPNLQRWLNRDPIGEWGGINLYRFVRNSPLNWLDPLGLTVFPPGFVGPIQPGDSYGGPIGPADAEMIAQENLGVETLMIGIAGGAESGIDEELAQNEAQRVEQEQQQQMTGPNNPITPTPCPTKVDPAKLRLPPTRADGADPFKLANLMKNFGNSVEGMPPIQVTQGANGEMMINDGVTRATLAAMNQNQVPAIVIESNPSLNLNNLPTVGGTISGKR